MPGRSPKKKYGEFRVFIERMGRGKVRIRPEFVPSLAAWLLMQGQVYGRAIHGMRHRMLTDNVPGMAEAVASLDACTAHLQRLLTNLPNNFSMSDWEPAVEAICELMGIHSRSTPLEEVPAGQFEHLIDEVPDGGIED